MCGNDISTIIVPGNEIFLQQLRTQISKGKISVKNSPQGQKQQITMAQIAMISRFDTSKVKQLQLIRCDLNHELIEQLFKLDWTSLKNLSLNHNKIGPLGCRIIASCQSLSNLKSLQLADNKIKDAGVKALATSKFTDLQDININDNGITKDGLKSLKLYQSIDYLSVCGNGLNDQCIETIKQINKSGFIYLAVSRNNFTNRLMQQFIPSAKLQILLIDRNKVTVPKSQLQSSKSQFIFY